MQDLENYAGFETYAVTSAQMIFCANRVLNNGVSVIESKFRTQMGIR